MVEGQSILVPRSSGSSSATSVSALSLALRVCVCYQGWVASPVPPVKKRQVVIYGASPAGIVWRIRFARTRISARRFVAMIIHCTAQCSGSAVYPYARRN